MAIKQDGRGGAEQTGRPPRIRGIHIGHMQAAFIVISCILYGLLGATAYHVAVTLDDTYAGIGDFAACTQSEASFLSASDYLTEQARLYTVTGEREYVDNYFQEALEARRRENAIEELSRYALETETVAALQSALERSNALMEREVYAIRLMAAAQGQDVSSFPQAVREAALTQEDRRLTPEELGDKARGLVFGATYQAAKGQLKGDVEHSFAALSGAIKGRMEKSHSSFQASMRAHGALIGAHFAAILFGFLFIILLVVLPLTAFVRRIKAGEPLRVVGAYECKRLAQTCNDMFAQNAAQKDQLRRQADHDALTGLLNRGAFDTLQQSLSGESRPVGLLIVDVDKFKQVNDGYGHETGDKVLQKVAGLLAENFQSIGRPARIGGDEFAVILTQAGQEEEGAILAKINAINETLTHPDGEIPAVSLSVGGAFSESGFSGSLYKRADLALYEVKEHGRCGCRFYAGQELPA